MPRTVSDTWHMLKKYVLMLWWHKLQGLGALKKREGQKPRALIFLFVKQFQYPYMTSEQDTPSPPSWEMLHMGRNGSIHLKGLQEALFNGSHWTRFQTKAWRECRKQSWGFSFFCCELQRTWGKVSGEGAVAASGWQSCMERNEHLCEWGQLDGAFPAGLSEDGGGKVLRI